MIISTFRLFVAALTCLSLVACGSPVRYRATDAQATLQPGDEVVIVLKSGPRYRGKIAQITDTKLITERSKYAWAEIQYVTREELDAGKTAATSVGVTVLLVAVAVWFMKYVIIDGLEGD